MEEIFKRILDSLTGANFWIALGCLAAGIVCWLLIGKTKKQEKKLLRRQITSALIFALLAGGAIWINNQIFLREPDFSKDVTGILVMRFVGDDALNSLQGDLVAKLNAELQKEAAGGQIEVHAGHEDIDENKGLALAHERARSIGQQRNARLVIWGRKIGEKKFYPRITVPAAPEDWSAARDRTHDEQIITELRLPEELVDEPFYLIHFAAGYSYYDKDLYGEALPHFQAALRRKGGSQDELADLQFFTAFCYRSLAAGQKDMAAGLQTAIELFQKVAKTYETVDQESWARTQFNLGRAYQELPSGDRAANLQKAIAFYEAALRVYTEKDFPKGWSATQNNIGTVYLRLPIGDRAENVQRALAAFEMSLRVRTEKDFPADWADAQNNIGAGYFQLTTGNRTENLQRAIDAYQAAMRVRTKENFPAEWAMTQRNLGLVYSDITDGNRMENLKIAKIHFQAALGFYTESGYPEEHEAAAANLAEVELELRNLAPK